MKTYKPTLWLPILMSISLYVSAQSVKPGTGGLYKSSEDFINQKLAYPFSCDHPGDKIKLNDFFGSVNGEIIVNGEKNVFDKTKTYGYRRCDNKNFRFYNNDIYQIIDTQGFFLYYQYRTEFEVKGISKRESKYFFSSKPDGQIIQLSVENLEKAYSYNTKFRYKLYESNIPMKDLAAYDPYLKMYKIKYLYYESVK